MEDSNWSQSKARSNYHFDPYRVEPEGYAYRYCGRVIGDWSSDLDEAVAKAVPKTWRTRGKKYHPDHPDLRTEEKDLERAGVDKDITILRKHLEFSPRFDRLCDVLGLEHVKRAIHVQFPGELLQLHIDKQFEMSDRPETVMRFFIMLTDWEPGHFLQFGNTPLMQWHAGDIYTFDWMNIPHASANASWKPRALIQITGTMSNKTRALIQGFPTEFEVSNP